MAIDKLRVTHDALQNIKSIARLDELRGAKGSLTSNQEADWDSAVRDLNAQIEDLNRQCRIDHPGMPYLVKPLDDGWTGDDLMHVAGVLNGAVRMFEGEQKALELRKWRGDEYVRPDSTGMETYAAGDDLRAMIEAHEGQHDFDLVHGFTETRAIADFSDSSALYTAEFSSKFAFYLRTESPWMHLATVVRAKDGRPMTVPGISTDSTTYTNGEGTAVTESSPTLSDTSISLTKYAVLSYISNEALEDAAFNVSDYIARSAARSVAQDFGSAATATVIAGISNAGTATGAGGLGTATNSYVGWEDLIDQRLGRAAPYRNAATWVLSNSAMGHVAKMRDQMGEYFWSPETTNAGPLSSPLLGNPVAEDPYGEVLGSASKSFVFGDVGAGLVIKMRPVAVRISPDFRLNYDQTAVLCTLRAGIGVVDSAAMSYLVSAAT